MNLILKSAVGTALGLAAVGANALGVPASNSSDLVLVIQNEVTPANVYVLDTGISINSALGTGALVTGASLDSTAFSGINASIAASATLTNFLAANPASGDGWTIEAGQYSGLTTNAQPVNAATKNPGKAYGIFSNTAAGTVSNVNLATFQGFLTGLQADYVQPTDNLGISGLNGPTEATGTQVPGGASLSPNAAQKYALATAASVGPQYDLAALATSAQPLYAITGNGNTGLVQSYILGTATLDTSGNLTIAGNAVPLPPAVWLFGSGLLGLVGVSRRRKATV